MYYWGPKICSTPEELPNHRALRYGIFSPTCQNGRKGSHLSSQWANSLSNLPCKNSKIVAMEDSVGIRPVLAQQWQKAHQVASLIQLVESLCEAWIVWMILEEKLHPLKHSLKNDAAEEALTAQAAAR